MRIINKNTGKIDYSQQEYHRLMYNYYCNPLSNPLALYIFQRPTGLHDKNGIEIYEGDQLHIAVGYTSKVEFKDGMFVSVYNHPEDGEIIPLIDAISDKTLIIGNN